MMTASITILPYLAEYLKSKFKYQKDGIVKLPDTSDLYHAVWQLMSKRPVEYIEKGNIIICLPKRRIGKDPLYYNYLSQRSVAAIENIVRREFNFEIHRLMLENDESGHVKRNIDIAYEFLYQYKIESISVDAILKNYYRYRERVRTKKVRRQYTRR